jgi:diguanylate cyclase (GGDEF)-like protein
MNNTSFWKKGADKIEAMIEAVDRNIGPSYIWITDQRQQISWCSGRTRDFFGLSEQIYSDFEKMLEEYVHPYDREEYRQGIDRRLQGSDLEQEFCIRMKDTGGTYFLFSIHTEMLRDDAQEPEYLIVSIKNENIEPDFDPLTDLYSEARFFENLENMLNRGENFALLQIQIEGFHTFNLIYGVTFANELLCAIAVQFIYMMDADKMVFRLAGEQFVFILKNVGRQEVVEFEQAVRQVLERGIEVFDQTLSLKMAAGAILIEQCGGDVSSICGQVRYALRHSHQKHKGELVIFNDEVATAHGVDLALMKVIHQSVSDGCEGFYVEYQPIVDSNTGEVVGAEALVRWKKEPYGIVPPFKFIEWMETDPSMYNLGNYVLRTALSETLPILDDKPDFFVNVNISAKQLERPQFRGAVQQILKDTGFPANHLCMELTERCRDFPVETLQQEVEYFQSLGIRMAMDDYGTGSASSGIVMNLPMDEIKIDMSFIRGIMDNPKNQAMVHSIVDFANKSDMYTCLEGVENEELQNYLRGFGATWFQGYYYAKPLPIEKLKEKISG